MPDGTLDLLLPRAGCSLWIQIRGFEMTESRIWRKVLVRSNSWLPLLWRTKQLRWPGALASTSGGDEESAVLNAARVDAPGQARDEHGTSAG